MEKEFEALHQIGYNNRIKELMPSEVTVESLARVVAQHKDRYVILSKEGLQSAEITGNMRYAANHNSDFPAVGDWVKKMDMDDEHAIILEVYPRYSQLERQAIGKFGETQVIATNIDTAFIVQAVGHDFNLNRLERYLAICHSANIEPVILLTKIDLVSSEETERLVAEIEARVSGIKVLPLSVISDSELTSLRSIMIPFKTYCFIGSSGVGKSTIVNALRGIETLKTQEISSKTNKGKHTTTHRELILLTNGSIVIDTPGMREIGMINDASGIELTYDNIAVLATQCQFSDCRHEQEKGCAVIQAIDNGELSIDAYENYMKLKREQEHFSSSIAEKRKKDKALGKMYKSIMKEKKKSKF